MTMTIPEIIEEFEKLTDSAQFSTFETYLKNVKKFVRTHLEALVDEAVGQSPKEIYDIDDTPRSAPNMHGYNEGINAARQKLLEWARKVKTEPCACQLGEFGQCQICLRYHCKKGCILRHVHCRTCPEKI